MVMIDSTQNPNNLNSYCYANSYCFLSVIKLTNYITKIFVETYMTLTLILHHFIAAEKRKPVKMVNCLTIL